MNILSVENVSKSYTDKVLLKDASLFLHENEKIGIIGINGTGKSTLLKIIAGIEEPQSGKVTKANGIVIGYLPQHPVFRKDETVLEYVRSRNPEKEAEAKAMLTKFGLSDYDVRISSLSGGQKKRAALISVLISQSDILVLDEPTNHIDSEMAEFLEDYLKKFKGAIIMVTHDRYFLDSISTSIVEIDNGKLYRYDTNYSGFLALKAEREDIAFAQERKRKSILRTELEWIKRGAQARSTKQKARIERYETMKNMKGPKAEDNVEISSVASRLGKKIIELENISKSQGGRLLFKDFSYIFLKNDRVGFIGKNGCGKTTLMKIIFGELKPDSGKVTIGQTVKIGYYSQEFENDDKNKLSYMDSDKKVLDYIRDTAEYVKTDDGLVSASQMLEKFLFPPDLQHTPIGRLSGGEKRRLNLLRVLMEAPNVLILDEPTNDLDIATMTIFEQFLDTFDGIVITVSHDRYFLDRTVNRIFAFEGTNIKQYEGGYTDYKNKCTYEEETEKPVAEKKTYINTHEKKLKFTYKEQKEFETIESDISSLETKIADLEEAMAKSATDFVKLSELTEEKKKLEKELEYKMERWEYLEELNEKIMEQEK
ncbi:MAG: ABC-F family ATP-binding cassette domain-containing protein [Clostridia bacterium]|nr:ABC-F family ATP-binding cassette domain-containing protein [Clostridia bacterium]